jgi:hypothetical protein
MFTHSEVFAQLLAPLFNYLKVVLWQYNIIIIKKIIKIIQIKKDKNYLNTGVK